MTKLSILIPTTPERKPFLDKLFVQFEDQLSPFSLRVGSYSIVRYACKEDVEILVFPDNKQSSVGAKRNAILSEAKGEYIASVDSDDRISNNYFKLLFEGIEKGVDCCSLKGVITEDGKNPLIFEHSIKYKEYKTNPEGMPVRYERYPNHLNCIKASIAKQFKFPDKNHSEDTEWATQIFNSGLIKTEHYIDEIIYYYDYISNKK